MLVGTNKQNKLPESG